MTDQEIIELVKQLRAETGYGLMDCKYAITRANGDIEKARDILRKRWLAGRLTDYEYR